MVKQDDYRLRNGTVLEYTESGYDRTDSEYECAKSWLIKGDPGCNLQVKVVVGCIGYAESNDTHI